MGVALLSDEDGRLLGMITDGDVRRAILKNVPLSEPVTVIANPDPLVGSPDISQAEALHLMDTGRTFVVNHLPIVDDNRHVTDLILRRDLVCEEAMPVKAVIMAGGFGSRLRPLTEDVPKPMLPVGGRPLMEHAINQLRLAGIKQVHVTTHYMQHKIAEYFGNGEAFGLEINYVPEEQPLGTAGALGLMNLPAEPVLVINGDIITRVDFRAMLNYHREHKADMTIAVRQYSLQIPYGVVECEGPDVSCVNEKPRYTFLVNAGIYLLEPSSYKYIPTNGVRFDMTDLIQGLIQNRRTVISFPIMEYWLDIGQIEDYEKAQADLINGSLNL